MAESVSTWIMSRVHVRQKEIAYKAFTLLTDFSRTPVFTSSYINSMRVKKGSIDPSVTLINRDSKGIYDPTVGGGDSLKPVSAIKFRKGEESPVYVSNSLPYAGIIESGTATKPAGAFFHNAAMEAVKG